jgi:formate dehydrogenase subunit gamma
MQSPLRRLMFALVFAFAGAGALAQSNTVPDDPAGGKPPAGAPPGFTAPADPKPDENNAQRAVTQPGNNAPFWRGVRESGHQPGFTTLPDNEGGTLIQRFTQYPGSAYTTAGEAWRQVRNSWIVPGGAALIVFALVVLALFYKWRGPIGGDHLDRPKPIERFTYFERAIHWTVAITFVVLAVSGIVMAFGKYFLLPIIGASLFGWLTYALKTLHNVVGPIFGLALLVFIAAYVRDNIPRAYDVAWLKKGGGMISGEHVGSHKFNAGEKIVFWGGVIALGIVVVLSGLVLDKLVPGMSYTRGQMQIGHMVHAVASMLMMALFLGHMYLGTIGMKGAYQAMKTGRVSEDWAREHHEFWYDDIKAGKVPAQRSARPDKGLQAAKESA